MDSLEQLELLRENSLMHSKIRRYEQLLKIIGIECKQFMDDIDEKKEPVKEAEPEIAHWIICSDGYYPYCSNCKTEPKSGIMSKFCPECGRKMEDGK